MNVEIACGSCGQSYDHCTKNCPVEKLLLKGRATWKHRIQTKKDLAALGIEQMLNDGWDSRFVRDYEPGDMLGLVIHISDLICNLDIKLSACKRDPRTHIQQALNTSREITERLEEAVILQGTKNGANPLTGTKQDSEARTTSRSPWYA